MNRLTLKSLRFFAQTWRYWSSAWTACLRPRGANGETIARRIATLAASRHARRRSQALIVLTTVNALLQKFPPREFIAATSLKLQPGNVLTMQALIERLEISGYMRAGTVTDPGQYAVRGGILDLYPPGGDPIRLDFFGDTLESIRAFDPIRSGRRRGWNQCSSCQ